MKQLYSYDIFDTCLVRTCGEPKCVFDILATDVLGGKADISAKIDFTLIRMNAERKARETLINGDNEEISLEDIYRFCDFSKITAVDNKAIMTKELEVEDRVLLPVYKIREEIEHLVKKGAKIIYISDMYLPESFICKKLKQAGFYVNHNIYLSSTIKKTKSSGNLFRHVSRELGIKNSQWIHTGDNTYSDYRIPKEIGINAKLIKHNYNQYELMEKEMMHDGRMPNAEFPFSLSRAIRLSLPDTPYNLFASTFVAPMFVSYVYSILNDARKRSIKHLFFIARDGFILYNIAKEFASQFSDIRMSYLYASRQALYMAGLSELSVKCVKETLPYLKNEEINKILYELHLSSYDYSQLPIKGLNGEQIIDLLFDNDSFVKELQLKYQEQNSYIIRYFEQEGLTEEHCAIVDVVGSRRCQKALNNILSRNHYQKAFSYYFEVTWSRITDYEPYLAMNYQENVISTKFYNRASQPLYEQFFAITNQKRTIEYKDNKGVIEPVFESDFISEEYKQAIFETNKINCIAYARHYVDGCIQDPALIIQVAQKAFAFFCYAPRKEFLLAIESFRCTGSGEANEVLLNKRSLFYTITHIKQFFRWPEGQLIYSSGWLYPLILKFLDYRYKRKQRK